MKKKSTGWAYLWWLIGGFGVFGFHRFYLGHIGTGFLYIFTMGVFGIGALIDLFRIPSMVEAKNNEILAQESLKTAATTAATVEKMVEEKKVKEEQ